MSKSTIWGVAGILAVIASILGFRVLFDRCSFGFYAADAWPHIEERIGSIDGSIQTAIELLDDGKISEARSALTDAQRASDELYRRYFSESDE